MHSIGSVAEPDGNQQPNSRTTQSVEAGPVYQKLWGTTRRLFGDGQRELWRIQGRPGGFCSRHRHMAKDSLFLVVKGLLRLVRYECGRSAVSIDLRAAIRPKSFPLNWSIASLFLSSGWWRTRSTGRQAEDRSTRTILSVATKAVAYRWCSTTHLQRHAAKCGCSGDNETPVNTVVTSNSFNRPFRSFLGAHNPDMIQPQ